MSRGRMCVVISPAGLFRICMSSNILFVHMICTFSDTDTTEDEKTKKMAQVDGGYMFLSSLFAALLAFGVDPVMAMGYTSIFCIPLFFAVLELVSGDLFGMSTEAWTFVLVAFIGASAYGMLESKETTGGA